MGQQRGSSIQSQGLSSPRPWRTSPWPVARRVEKVLGWTWTLWPASRVGGLSGLCWFFLDLGQFGGGRVQGSSVCLWLRLPLAFGGLVVVVVGLLGLHPSEPQL